MGAYDSYYTGRITITPPLTWAELQERPGINDIRIVENRTTEDTAAGQVITITGIAVESARTGPCSGYYLAEELQKVIDAYPRNEFTGIVEARPEDPHGGPWRYIIRDRTVVRQEPRTTWVDSEHQ